ncbi:unnamed protein product [Didymodactylos carnosus]|uniref:PKD/REJ-like domain-containing protein n=1 Tax=Didymodactylos carnosus TaxID=1234261 RepID=A0A816AND7_9BILA|nr:unnamed protein product [Didymodactylos carnosus]CAF1597801.1 unnamed protein product [Didymodactylos carnosus]CAF4013406.1 unnamed protein product [Didymodactylos carnosus]CAF4473399.1 unnamed protein product [Didymodactylos carnosus]
MSQSTITVATTLTITTATTTVILGCTLLLITFNQNAALVASASNIQRRQAYSIIVTVPFNYPISSLENSKPWEVSTCTSSSTCNSQLSNSLLSRLLTQISSKIYLPALLLPYDLYEFKFTVSMLPNDPQSSSKTYVRVIPTSVIVQPLKWGTSMIVHQQSEGLKLEPGLWSTDPDSDSFIPDVGLVNF